jgi:acyl dehydratase
MSPRWDDLTEGSAPSPLRIGPVTRTDSVRYQGASGDMNPIHHDDVFAQTAGFSAPVTVGMFQAGVMHAWLAAWLGPANVRRVSMRWREPVFPGDVLTFAAKVVKKYEEQGERRVDVELSCTKQTGAIAVTGSGVYVVPD